MLNVYQSWISKIKSIDNSTQNTTVKQVLPVLPALYIQKDPVYFFKSILTKAELKVLDYLLFFDANYRYVSPSQERIARYAYISRSYCNQILKKLERYGLLKITSQYFRGKQRSSRYQLSYFFKNPTLRQQLSSIFKTFKAFSLSLLVALPVTTISSFTPRKLQGEKLTPYKREYFNKYGVKSYISHRQTSGFRSVGSMMANNSLASIGLPSVVDGNPISPAIRSIKTIPLTRWGQIKLSAFDDTVIEAVKVQFNAQRTKIHDPYTWFFMACIEYCKVHKIAPDWNKYQSLAKKYNMPERAPMVQQRALTAAPSPVVGYASKKSPQEGNTLINTSLQPSLPFSNSKSFHKKEYITPEQRAARAIKAQKFLSILLDNKEGMAATTLRNKNNE